MPFAASTAPQHYGLILYRGTGAPYAHPVTRTDVDQARELQRRYGTVPLPTDLVSHHSLDQFITGVLGRDLRILLKDERQNPTGSFKDRSFVGPLVALEEGRVPEVIQMVSTGNHGAAGAHGVQRMNEHLRGQDQGRNVRARVTIDVGVLPHKRDRIRSFGAEIRDRTPQGAPIKSYRQAEDLVHAECRADPGRFLQVPHADPFVEAGYATMALEIATQLKQQHGLDLEQIQAPGEVALLVPLGSAGLFAGLLFLKTLYPQVSGFAMAAAPAHMSYLSLLSGESVRIDVESDPTNVVDGTMATPEAFALNIVQNLAEGVGLVRAEDALYGAALLAHFGVEVEATSGLCLAGLLLYPNHFAACRAAVLPLTSRHLSASAAATVRDIARSPRRIYHHFVERRRELQQGEREERQVTVTTCDRAGLLNF